MSRRLRALAKWTELSSQHSYGASEPSTGLCVVHVQAGKTLTRIIYIFQKGKKISPVCESLSLLPDDTLSGQP